MDNQNIDPTEYREPMKADASRPPRGKLKIFFGYAAGVGKTYAMLDAARMHKAEGVHYAPVIAALVTLVFADFGKFRYGGPTIALSLAVAGL